MKNQVHSFPKGGYCTARLRSLDTSEKQLPRLHMIHIYFVVHRIIRCVIIAALWFAIFGFAQFAQGIHIIK